MSDPVGRCRCGGDIVIRDWQTHDEWRYEVQCVECGTCDPNGYGSRKQALIEGVAYLGERNA